MPRTLWRAEPLRIKKNLLRDPFAIVQCSEVRGNTRPALGHLEMSNDQSKYWCFTLNNYTDAEENTLQTWLRESASYATYGYEIGECGTPHLQGYLELEKRVRFATLKNKLSTCGLDRIHLERRKGNAQQASDYCHKESIKPGFFYGTLSKGQGSRSDLIQLREDLLAQKPLHEIAQEHFGNFIRYQRGINAFRSIMAEQRNWQMEVHVFWGKTGTGKTRRVFAECASSGEAVYSHPGGPWFDGYDQQPVVLFDEFSGSYFALPYLLKLLDRYPMQVPIKGGFVSFIPRKIYITSNYAPESWYGSAKTEHVAALIRRLTNVEEFIE